MKNKYVVLKKSTKSIGGQKFNKGEVLYIHSCEGDKLILLDPKNPLRRLRAEIDEIDNIYTSNNINGIYTLNDINSILGIAKGFIKDPDTHKKFVEIVEKKLKR